MRKNVTIGLSPAEYIRVQGAAAVANMPLATYLKWLLRGGALHDELGQNIGTVLERLDRIGVAIARLPRCAQAAPSPTAAAHSCTPTPSTPPVQVSRELIEQSLRHRGVPTSTIRQLFVVLDEHGILR